MFSLFKTPESGKDEGINRRHTREPVHAAAGGAQESQALTGAALRSPASGRLKLGFVGLAAGSGATTLSFAAAEYLAALLADRNGRARTGSRKSERTVTMLELDLRPQAPEGWPYDKIGIDRRFAGRDYISLYRLAAEGLPLHGVRNIDGGIGWALRVPGESVPTLSVVALHRLLSNVPGDIVVCDIPAHGILGGAEKRPDRDALLALLADLDHLICVFDPLPSRLLASVPAAEICRAAAASGVPVTNVFNKMSDGVNLREATRFTGVKDYLPFPAVPAEAVYAAEYACRSLAPELKPSLARLVPD